ncbi:hypothetical protein V5O48_009846 [Marasmius crinis-equi]|uniref:RlpA-like protein double-psi beta-barrel domain-containing protein n=1 Tax=Marasmius crinis-equi TaxID=585013 RepID=A0ABR3FA50_9AGAR
MFSKVLLVAAVAVASLANAAPANLVARQVHTVTWYDPGLGACGITNGPNDLIAAVSVSVYNNFPGATPNPNLNPICKKKARVTANGKSVDVTIVDKCPGCSDGSIDLSPAAFKVLAAQSVGRIHGGSWVFI